MIQMQARHTIYFPPHSEISGSPWTRQVHACKQALCKGCHAGVAHALQNACRSACLKRVERVFQMPAANVTKLSVAQFSAVWLYC